MHDLTEAIAAAHAALDERFYPGPTEEMVRAAIEAAAPVIAAKALREAAADMRRCKDPGHWNLRDLLGPESSYSPDVWLEVRADALEAGQS